MKALLESVQAADSTNQETCDAGEISDCQRSGHVRGATARSDILQPSEPAIRRITGSHAPMPVHAGPSNENWPILELRPTGNGAALARMLVRVLVRRALIQEGIIRIANDCTNPTRAG
jgi:hypothetical protein